MPTPTSSVRRAYLDLDPAGYVVCDGDEVVAHEGPFRDVIEAVQHLQTHYGSLWITRAGKDPDE